MKPTGGVPPIPAEPRQRPRAAALGRDLQSLLASAVQRVHAATRARGACAWALRDDGTPYVAAASFDATPPSAPDAAAFAAAGRLAAATDLLAPDGDPALRALGARFGVRAAVPVRAPGGTAVAVLCLDANAAPQPSQLAALAAAAERLRGPVLSALALARLAVLDADVRRLDRLAALGTVAAEIAHEVRNALVSVKTFLQLLPERRDDPELWERFPRLVEDELRRTERLLDAVIEHGRPAESEAAGAASVAQALEAVAGLVGYRARTRGVRLETDVARGLPDVELPDDGLRQVLLNLLLNAIEATPSGGTVTLSASAAGGRVTLRVTDDGPGIPEELRHTLFEPFTTTRSSRAGGLGLAISRRIVQDAGGTIRASNSPPRGAQLTVDLGPVWGK